MLHLHHYQTGQKSENALIHIHSKNFHFFSSEDGPGKAEPTRSRGSTSGIMD